MIQSVSAPQHGNVDVYLNTQLTLRGAKILHWFEKRLFTPIYSAEYLPVAAKLKAFPCVFFSGLAERCSAVLPLISSKCFAGPRDFPRLSIDVRKLSFLAELFL